MGRRGGPWHCQLADPQPEQPGALVERSTSSGSPSAPQRGARGRDGGVGGAVEKISAGRAGEAAAGPFPRADGCAGGAQALEKVTTRTTWSPCTPSSAASPHPPGPAVPTRGPRHDQPGVVAPGQPVEGDQVAAAPSIEKMESVTMIGVPRPEPGGPRGPRCRGGGRRHLRARRPGAVDQRGVVPRVRSGWSRRNRRALPGSRRWRRSRSRHRGVAAPRKPASASSRS